MMYEVDVTRERDSWLADVANLPGAYTWAKSLTGLMSNVIEVIRLADDLPDGAADPDVRFRFSGVSPEFAAAAAPSPTGRARGREARHDDPVP